MNFCILRLSGKKRRANSAHSSTISKNTDDEEVLKENPSIDEDVDDGEVNILQGTGRLTSSGTTIKGHYTEFMNQLTPGDAIIIVHPTR